MITEIQYITQHIENVSHAELAEEACKGGINWIQLRVKNFSIDEVRRIALETKAVCKKYGATFIVNDHVQLAKEVDADGVHLGMEDMSPEEARRILGND